MDNAFDSPHFISSSIGTGKTLSALHLVNHFFTTQQTEKLKKLYRKRHPIDDSPRVKIERAPSDTAQYGIFDSWEIKSDTIALKKADKSFFDYSGSGIPMSTRWFWGVEHLKPGERKNVTLRYEGEAFSARISLTNGRSRIFWAKRLSRLCYSVAADDFLLVQFERMSPDTYEVTLTGSSPFNQDKMNVEVVAPPSVGSKNQQSKGHSRHSGHMIDFLEMHKKTLDAGEAGELLVLNFERNQLRALGLGDLAEQVHRTCDMPEYGNAAPFDIRSFEVDGTEKYIEVKTTCGAASTPFFLSEQERQFFLGHKSQYYLYRVYSYSSEQGHAKLYILRDIEVECTLSPSQYVVTLK